MSITAWLALPVIAVTIWALLKRYETRLVLFLAGLILCAASGNPMDAFNAFAKSMTKGALIMAICSSMGFAFVVTYTKCDKHLVSALAAPFKRLGLLLIPLCGIATFFVNIAIPSAAGCAATVGATFIPLLLRSGFRPAAAGAAVLAGTFGSQLAPGLSHNPFVANMANMDLMDLIAFHMPFDLIAAALCIGGVTVMAFLLKDNKAAPEEFEGLDITEEKGFKISPLLAICPLVPLTLLVVGNTVLPAIKMGVAQAMLIGVIFVFFATRVNPQEISKQFFAGAGKGYGDVMGIIIAAGVFAAGLKSCGAVGAFIGLLQDSNEIARWGGSIGPFLMAIFTGSGDAAAFAFNEAVTAHAADFGMTIKGLGSLAVLCGAMGRTMSPVAGVVIVLCGISRANPIDLVKRTAPGLIIGIIVVALTMV